jgi:hypothetical protein
VLYRRYPFHNSTSVQTEARAAADHAVHILHGDTSSAGSSLKLMQSRGTFFRLRPWEQLANERPSQGTAQHQGASHYRQRLVQAQGVRPQ